MKGHVRLLSNEQLLDFEGGLTSFPLGGHRQRFDLSSLKHRWRECPAVIDGTGPDDRQLRGQSAQPSAHIVGDPAILSGRRVFGKAAGVYAHESAIREVEEGDGAWTIQEEEQQLSEGYTRVTPLASVRRRFDEQAPPRLPQS